MSTPRLVADPTTDLSWQEKAACQGADLSKFFPGRGESAQPAKRICRRCDVKTECLQYALDRSGEQYGVFGGTSEQERRKIKRRSA